MLQFGVHHNILCGHLMPTPRLSATAPAPTALFLRRPRTCDWTCGLSSGICFSRRLSPLKGIRNPNSIRVRARAAASCSKVSTKRYTWGILTARLHPGKLRTTVVHVIRKDSVYYYAERARALVGLFIDSFFLGGVSQSEQTGISLNSHYQIAAQLTARGNSQNVGVVCKLLQ